jgi:transcription elongation factor SPT4
MLQNSDEAVEQCTSQVFEGSMAIVDPKKSWVAKWQRLTNYVPGVYALKVSGTLSEDVRLRIEQDFGVRYIPRDGTAQDE